MPRVHCILNNLNEAQPCWSTSRKGIYISIMDSRQVYSAETEPSLSTNLARYILLSGGAASLVFYIIVCITLSLTFSLCLFFTTSGELSSKIIQSRRMGPNYILLNSINCHGII